MREHRNGLFLIKQSDSVRSRSELAAPCIKREPEGIAFPPIFGMHESTIHQEAVKQLAISSNLRVRTPYAQCAWLSPVTRHSEHKQTSHCASTLRGHRCELNGRAPLVRSRSERLLPAQNEAPRHSLLTNAPAVHESTIHQAVFKVLALGSNIIRVRTPVPNTQS